MDIDIDNLYKIEAKKAPATKWSVYFTDREIAYDLENAKFRVAELMKGVEDLKDKKRFPRINAVDWKFKYRKLSSKEKNELADRINKRDNKLTAQEWNPLGLNIGGD